MLWALALKMMPGIGDVTAKRLIGFCGGLEGVFRNSREQLQQIPGIGKALVKAVRSGQSMRRAEEEMEFAQRNKIRIIPYLDTAYPARLRQCDDGPLILFVKGRHDLVAERVISIVGTRNATDYGRQLTRDIVRDLGGNVEQVVSGLAYGIDAEAHKAALAHGVSTVAVLAHGLDRVYPALHRKIALEMQENGALVTEFLSGSLPDRENFPKRNRIIAGMSDAVLVVEAAERGGALITADIADSYNRDVFALPGRVTDPVSQGCLNIIRTNKAALVRNAGDILYSMRWDLDRKPVPAQHRLFPDTDPDTIRLWELLSEPLSLDDITLEMQLPQGKLSAILLSMEIEGWVEALPGNRWARR